MNFGRSNRGTSGRRQNAALLLAFTLATLAIGAISFGGCTSGDEPGPAHASPSTPTPVATATPSPTEPPEPPKEFRVAFINLYSPLTQDAKEKVAGETFDERLDIIIRQLKSINPDLVAFNEATVTKQYGNAVTKLARELKLEFQYTRANPWFPGQTKEQSDELVKQVGFEEGELILSRYPITKWERRALNPRTSEAGEVRAALHAVIKGPTPVGEIDVYLTHLTGGGDRVRAAQAADFASFVAWTRGKGPTLVLVGQSDPAAKSTYEFYGAIGLHDVGGKGPVVTCCRESVFGMQPPVTRRSDYILSDRWQSTEWHLFGDEPVSRADGTLLYGSDHNGLWAAFPIPDVAASP